MEFKRCPFCGGSATVEYHPTRKGYEAVVQCTGCLVNMPTVAFDSADEAINEAERTWNRRKEANNVHP